ncbi:MAG: hypothetical protein Q8S33_34855 [Myxococcales bacterium]|nr:hypothetical protein [Myxococcales bacterium]MDP3505574.1 hypothetical protein [Myxococcales bacterium]
MQFVALSDSNASWFLTSPPNPALTMPLFRDGTAGRTAWRQLDPTASKHDTVVFDAAGQRVLSWKASQRSVSMWRTDIGAAVRALP